MSGPGGGESAPTPPLSSADVFRRLLTQKGKKHQHVEVPKFIKKLDEIPEIALPEEQSIKISLALSDRGLVGQFMGRWPSTKTTNDWIQRNWRPQLENNVICYAVGRGYFIFEFTTKEDRDLVFRNGPYFMGNKGLYLNKWSPDFDPSVDVPKEASVWVRLPNLPLHCWSYQSLQKIGNGLGRFIDKADHKGQYTCARICVEVDLESGLPEAIKLKRNCPKAPSGNTIEDEGWKEIRKGKAIPKPPGQKTTAPSGNPHINPEAVVASKDGSPSGEKMDDKENQEETGNMEKQRKKNEVESTVHTPEECQRGNEGNEEHISLASDSEGDSEERDSESDNSLATPIKTTRGRKSKKKQREEETYKDVLQGSQKTLKSMMNTRSGRKSNKAPMGAPSPLKSK
eukprot:PITA_20733